MNALAKYGRTAGSMYRAGLQVVKRAFETLHPSPTALDTVPVVVVDQWEVEHIARVRPRDTAAESRPFPASKGQ